jgi:hypothetical protein
MILPFLATLATNAGKIKKGVKVVQGIGKVAGYLGKDKAKDKARQAARLRRKTQQMANFQQSRAYMNKFLAAQGDALSAGALTGAGLGSSGVQGQLTSQRTQFTTGMVEQEQKIDLDQRAYGLEASSATSAGQAGFSGQVAKSAGLVADLASKYI